MRYHPKGQIYLVSNYCIQDLFLLLPTMEKNKIIGGWLGRALHLYRKDIEIFAFCFLSNNFNLLLRDKTGKLGEFMWYFELNLSKAVNRENKRKGYSFSGKYDATPVLTNIDFEVAYGFVTTNAVKSNLVAKTTNGPV